VPSADSDCGSQDAKGSLPPSLTALRRACSYPAAGARKTAGASTSKVPVVFVSQEFIRCALPFCYGPS
jgi:hypothetical protein